MNEFTRHKVGFFSSILLFLGSIWTLTSNELSSITTTVNYIFLISGILGIIIFTLGMKKTGNNS